MSEYITHSYGPGSIGALAPLAALAHNPTISANDPLRAIQRGRRSPVPSYPSRPSYPSLKGLGSLGGVLDFVEAHPLISMLPVVAIVGFYVYTLRTESSEDQMSALFQ